MTIIEDIWEWMNAPKDKDAERKGSPVTLNQQGSGRTIPRNGTVGPTRTSGAKASPVGGARNVGASSRSIGKSSDVGGRKTATELWGQPNRVGRTEFTPPRQNVGMNMPGIQQDEFADMIADLKGRMSSDFEYDGRYDDMINEAFGAQLSALANARNQTQGNFGQSSAALKDLYAGHVQDINTVDAQKYKAINQDLTQNLSSNYGNAASTIEADKNADLAEGEAMLQRLGLQAAAPALLEQSAGQSDALARIQEEKASALAQATEYGNADQTRNVARGQSVAGEGIQRQGDLHRQLQDILGDLSMREADVNSDRAMSLMEAEQMARQEWMGEREYAGDTLEMLLEQRTRENMEREDRQLRREEMEYERQQAEAENGPPTPLWNQVGQTHGIDIAPYRTAYARIAADGNFNSRDGADRVDYFVKRMIDDFGLDPEEALAVVLDIENAGTLKRQ